MTKLYPKFQSLSLSFLALGLLVSTLSSEVHAQNTTTQGNQSWGSSISSGMKKSLDKIGQTLNPKPTAYQPGPEDDAISLKNEGKAGPKVNIAWAHWHEQNGDLVEAGKQYQIALDQKPDCLEALLGLAQLKEKQGKAGEAVKLYQKAVKMYPREAPVHNNLGLCYARQGMLDQAMPALSRAVELEPKNVLYRNNIATVLVDKGKPAEAMVHLRAAHSEAEANYNLGFLLNKKGQTQTAIACFRQALQADPSMDSAKHWLEYLQKAAPQTRLAGHPISNGVKVVNNITEVKQGTVTMPQTNDAMLPDDPRPLRLPPVRTERPRPEGPYLPGISYGPTQSAPMPPPSANNTASASQLPSIR